MVVTCVLSLVLILYWLVLTCIDTPSTSMWYFLLPPLREVTASTPQSDFLLAATFFLHGVAPDRSQSIWARRPSPKQSSYLFQQSIIGGVPLTFPALFEHWDIVEWAGSFRPGELRYFRFSIRFPGTTTFLLCLALRQAEEWQGSSSHAIEVKTWYQNMLQVSLKSPVCNRAGISWRSM